MRKPRQRPHIVLVGGGLQSALIALAALDARPEARLTVLERDARPCGNHTWSFHETDVPAPLASLAETLAEHRWSDYDVRFPDGARRIGIGYRTISSSHLADVLRARLETAPNAVLRTNADVVELDAAGVTLTGGERLPADLVVDARGPERGPTPEAGFQKFLGLELELEHPHGLERPLVMDATVEQVDGFRFLYLLPFSPTRVLLEDTVFSTGPDLDRAAWRRRALDEAHARGWMPQRIVRAEHGVLPMPWAGDGPELQREGPFRAGYRGQYFHAATGFSFPQALRVAALIARHVDAPGQLLASTDYARFVRREQRHAGFARFLNRLLFTGVAPATRYTVFERFYRHPEGLIARFYAGTPTRRDRARMLVGKPPRGFSVRSALAGKAYA